MEKCTSGMNFRSPDTSEKNRCLLYTVYGRGNVDFVQYFSIHTGFRCQARQRVRIEINMRQETEAGFVKNNNRINDLSVLFACNNYCIALEYSIIIIIINEICMRNNSLGFMFDLSLV